MPHHDAFVQAIIENPDDDTPRLVYADWLAEHGDAARAEFIRVQIALAALDRHDPDAQPLFRRQGELWQQHRENWLAELPELPEGIAWGEFRRGFIDEVRASSAEGLRGLAERILAAVPLRRLALVCWNAKDSLAGSPLLRPVRELNLLRNHHIWPGPPADTELLGAVLAWPEMEHLTHLELRSLELTPDALAPLVRAELLDLTSLHWEAATGGTPCRLDAALDAPWWPRLRCLALVYHRLTDGLVRALCGRLTAGRLRRLRLERTYLTDGDAADLAASGLLSGLELLDLERNDIGPEGTQRLAAALPGTALLILASNPIGDGGLAALADTPLPPRLGMLGVSKGTFGDTGALAIARSSHGRGLRVIGLSRGQVTSAGAAALLTSAHLPDLERLTLFGNRIAALPACARQALEHLFLGRNPLGATGLTEFCASSHLPRLVLLGLEAAGLGPEAAQALANAPGLPALKELTLSGNPLGDTGAAALAAGRGLPALEILYLRDCGIGDRGLEAWHSSQRLGRLKKLQLLSDGNAFTKQEYEAFRDAAFAQGCDVDSRSRKPLPRRALRRGSTGGLLLAEDRIELTRWLGSLWFAEYHTVGWLKAVAVQTMRKHVEKPCDLRLLDRYLRNEDVDDDLRREVIRLFLREWVMYCVPESVGVWGLEVAEFRPAGRDEALALVEGIIATSLEDDDAVILGRLPPYVVASEPAIAVKDAEEGEVQEEIPYAQLQIWFGDELFDRDTAVYYVHTSAGGPTVRFNLAEPRVLGMDRDVIALVWLE
jgi:uncharacterized protein (TIGR02996 family)